MRTRVWCSSPSQSQCESPPSAHSLPRKRRRVFLTSLFTLLSLAIVGVASAYWSGWGAGSSSAATGTALALTLAPGTATGDLVPGGQTAVVLTLSNPNGFAVYIGSLTLDTSQGVGGYGVDAGHSACAVSAFTFTTQTNSGTGWTVPEKVGTVNGTLSATLASALTMSIDAANACQGASITVYLSAGP
jgi:hypothetical protein